MALEVYTRDEFISRLKENTGSEKLNKFLKPNRLKMYIEQDLNRVLFISKIKITKKYIVVKGTTKTNNIYIVWIPLYKFNGGSIEFEY